MKIGIVGLPNAGKSTIFNALSNAHAKVLPYPFTTIEPNIGTVNVPDCRLEDVASVYKPIRVVPTSINFLDVAGLVKGASQGEGLGNKFLGNIREVDSVVQVVRYFKDNEVPHSYGNIDPLRDIEIINTELMLADLDIVEKNIKDKKGKKGLEAICDFLIKAEGFLKQGKMLNSDGLDEDELMLSREYGLLTSKTFIYVLNIGEEDINKDIRLNLPGDYITICGKWESDLLGLDEETRKEFMKDMNVNELGLHKLVRASYKSLNLITFFTTESKEVKAWTITKGTKAPCAAGKIHTDIEKGFIKAEVIPYEVLVKWKDPVKAKEHGEVKFEGKEYIVQDGDIIKFHFN
jgi:GTP-binding protein YchF